MRRALTISVVAAAAIGVLVHARTKHVETKSALQQRPRVALNASAAATSGVDALVAGGGSGLDLTGQGVVVGQWDQAGVRLSHGDLRGRVWVRDASGASDHATHVAGTIVGDGSRQSLARGMAPGAELWSWGWELDLAEMRQHAPYLTLSNHAYGFVMGWADNPRCRDRRTFMGRDGEREDRRFGKYGPEAAALDELIYETGLLTVWAGGNERQDAGAAAGEAHYHFPDCTTLFTDVHDDELTLQHDTLGLQLAAKNGLVVGAIGHVTADPVPPEEIVPLSFSGYGPMDDGRIKPDLVASGELVLSTVARADDAHQSFSGTSSSAAVVSGGIALLAERYRSLFEGADPPPELWKALLVQSARSASADGAPSYETGYGLFDAFAAAALLGADAVLPPEQRHMRLDAVGEGDVAEYTTAAAAAGEPLRVSLAWIDRPSSPNDAGIDDPTPALVNDLDLVLVSPDGREHHAWSLDAAAPRDRATRQRSNRVDTVEVVDVPAADNTAGGAWRVRVSLAGRPYRLRPQTFALVSSAALSPAHTPLLVAPRHVLAEVAPDGSSGPLVLALHSQNGDAIAWSARSEAGWLALDADEGVTPAELSVAVAVGALDGPGPHLGRLVIDADDVAPPHVVGVVVRVRCAPDCSGVSCGVDPVCGISCGGCALNEACDATGTCVAVPTGSCPNADLGSQLGPLVLATSTQGSVDGAEGSCGEGGPDQALHWVAPATGYYRFRAEGSGLDGTLHARDACDGVELGCASVTGGGAALTLPVDEGEEVVAFVDPRTEQAAVLFSAQRAPCPDADLGDALGMFLVDDTQAGLGHRLTGSCGGAGEEAIFAWTAPKAGLFQIAAQSSRSTVLHVRDASCDGTELGCTGEGVLELMLAQGQRIVVAVDTEGSAGRFSLGITSADGLCMGRCDGTPNRGQCHCDTACVELGDCCEDACSSCGHCCVPACEGKQCGDDGCGGACGECTAGELCDGAKCQPDACADLSDGERCDDGNACTVDDRCVGGRCAGVQGDCPEAPCEGADCADAAVDGGTMITRDASVDDAGPLEAAPPDDASGCGCSAPGNRRNALPWLSLLLACCLRRFALGRRLRLFVDRRLTHPRTAVG